MPKIGKIGLKFGHQNMYIMNNFIISLNFVKKM